MALTAKPFHPATGELLPSYRDAYLRGDLSGTNNDLVDAYLKANPAKGTETFYRFHTLQTAGHQVRPVGWLDQQLHLLRTEPVRFRRRAGSLVLAAALISGAVFAASGPASSSKTLATTIPAVVSVPESEALAPEAATAITTISGRILNEKGEPLVGATILDKRTGRGASTDASGHYTFAVPRSQAVQLQFGYGGYQETDLTAHGRSLSDVTLLPRTDLKKKHWWQF